MSTKLRREIICLFYQYQRRQSHLERLKPSIENDQAFEELRESYVTKLGDKLLYALEGGETL